MPFYSNSCCVPGCPGRGGHAFPTNKTIRNIWIERVWRGETDALLNTNSFVCRNHFTEDDYLAATKSDIKPKYRKLKNGAIPSIFEWNKSADNGVEKEKDPLDSDTDGEGGETAVEKTAEISTEEGRAAMKRIRVKCGVCRGTRFYSIHRGITRISGIVACEACRQFYQRFNKQPFEVHCARERRCMDRDEMEARKSVKCKACLVAQIIKSCPVSNNLYNKFAAYLPIDFKADLPRQPASLEEIPPGDRGDLGLEIYLNNDWVDVTNDKGEIQINQIDTNDMMDDGFEPDVGLEFEVEEEMVDDPTPMGSVEENNTTPAPSISENNNSRTRMRRRARYTRDMMDPDDRVMSSLLEGLNVNNQFMENFNPKNSERVRRKKKKVQYFNSATRGRREIRSMVHDYDGRLASSGKDLCDCLLDDCPGCHFSCPKCDSNKCGIECRNSRKWYYESVEVEGTNLVWYNEYMKK